MKNTSKKQLSTAKRIIAAVLCGVMMLLTSSCGMSKETRSVKKKIEVLEESSNIDEKNFKEAVNAYKALTDEQKAELDPRYVDVLKDAGIVYWRKKEADRITSVINEALKTAKDKTSSYSEVSADAKKAHDEYEKAGKKVKELIKNEKSLDEIDKILKSLDNQAKNIETAIKKIGTVTLDSKDTLENVKKLLDGKDDAFKSKIKNYKTYEEAKGEYDSLESSIKSMGIAGNYEFERGFRVRLTVYDDLTFIGSNSDHDLNKIFITEVKGKFTTPVKIDDSKYKMSIEYMYPTHEDGYVEYENGYVEYEKGYAFIYDNGEIFGLDKSGEYYLNPQDNSIDVIYESGPYGTFYKVE